ncbi:site-specific recombination directionality factor RDF [Delftia phage RG-2014]|uniref:Lipoprotein n=1 Tax=Delftia phage RG-2014 TaxID=1563661 RepID=A0A097PBD6_9CAUD|nr:site-specific recombination directionality factor RDF [Delftia phage RG-2014]AIU44301.1 hypothetical protein RG2014_047 [Delftia phage RG-2014]
MKAVLLALVAALSLGACKDDATVASANLSKAADNFEINRRIVFFNGITDSYLLSIEGRCSFVVESAQKVAVTCKLGRDQYKKHTLGLSDNVSFFSEQLDSADVSVYHYRVTFKPQSIIRDIDFRGSTTDLPRNQP